MSYYFNTIIRDKGFDKTIELVSNALKEEGFGVLTEIDIQSTLKKKLDVDFRKYKILGACNPHFAYKALQSEDKIGLMLPCNVVVEEHLNGDVEVAIIDPIASMSSITNQALAGFAQDVKTKLIRVLERLNNLEIAN